MSSSIIRLSDNKNAASPLRNDWAPGKQEIICNHRGGPQLWSWQTNLIAIIIVIWFWPIILLFCDNKNAASPLRNDWKQEIIATTDGERGQCSQTEKRDCSLKWAKALLMKVCCHFSYVFIIWGNTTTCMITVNLGWHHFCNGKVDRRST